MKCIMIWGGGGTGVLDFDVSNHLPTAEPRSKGGSLWQEGSGSARKGSARAMKGTERQRKRKDGQCNAMQRKCKKRQCEGDERH